MAEREGFEPSVPILSEHTISSRAPSATRASLRVYPLLNYIIVNDASYKCWPANRSLGGQLRFPIKLRWLNRMARHPKL